MDKMKKSNIAWKQCVNKGRSPIALIDAFIQFVDDQDVPMEKKDSEALAAAITAIRKANQRLDKVYAKAMGVSKVL